MTVASVMVAKDTNPNTKFAMSKEIFGDIIKAEPPFMFHCHNDIGKWYCELCPNYKKCKIKKNYEKQNIRI